MVIPGLPSLTSKKKGAFTTSKTLIDVIIHNEDMITDVSCIGCPFSDHHFVLASIDITLEKIKPELPDKGRHFSETNLNLINEKINSIDLSKIDFDADVDTIWKCIKNMTLAIVDDIAPLKHIKKKLKDQFPWHDKELREVKELKDLY